ncbi:hypothetical protein JOC85_001858 [Bacillus mesophilus]|uniref:Permease n=1 Tax=Bacillus mesophilus TaxID=1808955 RepID=A0A6M0Q4X0_9BACI|nr:hypothetical protein [Bacillus mesophilus]MBM7661086.1 hypothetical protein [Bacillus mesophilus]NEY71381.1 hypothetical protein [Bacillus mesophilus]
MYFTEKVLASVISAIAFAFFVTNANESGYLNVVFLVSLPIFLIVGGFCSYVIEFSILDKLNTKRTFSRYMLSVILYALFGIVALAGFTLVQGNFLDVTIQPLLLLGVLPALIYFHLSYLLRLTLTKFVMSWIYK